jgi:hypothetical protein
MGSAAVIAGLAPQNRLERGNHIHTNIETDEQENAMARKYSRSTSSKVKRAMHERKRGTLKSGRSGKKVKSRKQAIAIGLSQARRAGKKVPPRKRKSR